MAENKNIGYISQVIGPVVDVHFDVESDQTQLPRIHDALDVDRGEGRKPLVIEVQQHIGEDTVRCVAMDSTDGLRRGVDATDTGRPIAVPVGKNVLGRVLAKHPADRLTSPAAFAQALSLGARGELDGASRDRARKLLKLRSFSGIQA